MKGLKGNVVSTVAVAVRLCITGDGIIDATAMGILNAKATKQMRINVVFLTMFVTSVKEKNQST